MANEKISKPSEEFLLAIRGPASGVIDCEFCDRTHFAPDSDFDFEKGELEKLLKKNKENPDQYVVHNTDGVEWGRLAGRQYVLDCQCNEASKYEKLYWNDRYLIAKYFKLKTEKLENQAEESSNLAESIQNNL